MNLRDKYDALLALRPFVRTLPVEQIRLFHQIAARYAGSSEGFRDTVMAEFEKRILETRPVDELDIRLSVIRSLNGGAPAQATVDRVKAAWSQLSQTFREDISADIQCAIDDGKIHCADLALWREIRALAEAAAGKRPSLDKLRLAAAQVAYASYEFGCPVVIDRAFWRRSPSGREWKLPILIATSDESLDRGDFLVRFEDLTDTVREAYGILNGRILAPPMASLAL
jgi:hypothetical protein